MSHYPEVVYGERDSYVLNEQRYEDVINEIKTRKYECFMEDHEPISWTAGRCAAYAGRGSMALHLFRCKRKDGHGLGYLFCRQHAKDYPI